MSSVFDEAVRVYAYARTDVDMQVSMDKLGRARIEPKPPEVRAEPEDLAENLAGIEAAVGPMVAFTPDIGAARMTGEEFLPDRQQLEIAAGLPKGMAEGFLGIPGDIYGLIAATGKAGAYAQLKEIFPEDYPEQSLMVFAEEFGEISKSYGTEYFSDKFDGWLNKLPIDEATKENIRMGSGIGQFFGIPGAGIATAAGVKGIKAGAKTVAGATQEFIEGAPARVAARKADTSVQLNAGVDVPAAIDEAIVGVKNLINKTDEAKAAYNASPNDPALRKKYLDLRRQRDEQMSALPDDAELKVEADYRMQHQPRNVEEGGARLDDMTGGGQVFPDDVYSSKGFEYYGDSTSEASLESYNIIKSVRNKPDEEITIYRAVPKGVTDINEGDWVTLSQKYAQDHAESGYGADGKEAGEVISKVVKVRDVVNDGNDFNEFGYFPETNPTIVGAQKVMGKTDEPQPLDLNPEVIDLTPEERSGSIIPQLYEGEEIAPPATGKRTIFDVANEIDARTQTSGATAEMTPANKARIARVMAAETLHAMRKAGNAGDWYRTKVDNAMRIAQRVYPEAMEDPNKTQSLKFITAITSNGASVQDNAERTFQIFDDFLTSGRMPEKLEFGGGKERPAMEFGFKLYNDMVDEMGEDEFFDFLSQEFTVRELDEIGKQYGFKVSGENKDTLLPASVIFGPKIGGGFYQNLNGNYKPLTMDRWFMRSWGRYTGSLVVKQAEKTAQKQLERIRSEITPEIAQQFGYSHNELLADDDLLIELAQRAHKDYVRSGYKNKTELNKASKNFVEAQSKVLEAPGGGNQRNFMRDTVDEALDILRQQGVDLDRAALQALIWYPEKELYAKFGVGSKRSAPTDYETEFAKIANSRGVDVSDITGNANAE